MKKNFSVENTNQLAAQPKETEDVKSQKPKQERIVSIDRFRGLCMFVMVISFFLGAFGDTFLKWSKLFEHGAEGFQVLPGVAFADLFAPMFIFVIGLTFVKSFKSRESKYGTKKAFFQIAVRYLGLMGVGVILNGFEDGWLDVFNGTKFSELDKSAKLFAVCFWIAIALVILVAISKFFKNQKFKDISSWLLRYSLAAMGIIALYFVIVTTSERIGEHWPATYTAKNYGAWWDTLQNIGLAGLIALPFVKFDKWGKLLITSITFIVMTIVCQHGAMGLVSSVIEGGIMSGFCWAGILLLGSVFVELKDDKIYWVLASLMMLISVVLIVAFDFTAAKRGCTPVYAMFTASLAAMIFAGLDALNRFKPKFAFFSWWGGSSLLVYVVNYMVCLILGAILEVTKFTMPIWAALLIIVAFLALYSVGNWLLYRKDKHVRL